MKASRFTAEQIVAILHEAAAGAPVRELCRKHGITVTTFDRWRRQYGGLHDGQPQRPLRDAPVRARLREVAAARPRFGYVRLGLLVRREGVVVNLKRVYRVYREERLLVRPHRGRKHAAVPRVPFPAPTQPNERWGMDFIHDACAEGRRFRCLTMVDEYTRECPVIAVDTSLPAARVIGVLEQLAGQRGLPRSLIVDHGPEFISRALDLGAYRRGIELIFIRPGKPVENAYVESFHSRFRDERLSTHWFETVPDSRVHIECWRQDDNEVRPHTSLAGRTPTEFAKTLKENDQITRHSA